MREFPHDVAARQSHSEEFLVLWLPAAESWRSKVPVCSLMVDGMRSVGDNITQLWWKTLTVRHGIMYLAYQKHHMYNSNTIVTPFAGR